MSDRQHIFPLLTERLMLRAMRPDDADALTAIYTDPRVMRWIGAQSDASVAAEVERQISYQREHGWSFWAIEERASGRVIGDCGLQPLAHTGPEVELGYDLHPAAWGRGLATEAARAVVAVALGPLGIDEVVAVVKPQHAASRRVLEKVGLELVGPRFAYGEDMLLYAIRRGAAL